MLRSSILLLALFTLPARANLGETVAQCVARYGSPTHYSEANEKFPFGTLTFVAGPYGLIVFIFNNKEVGARVSKADNSAFTEAEMQTIMGADSAVGPWTPTTTSDPDTQQWSRSDKAKVAYDKKNHLLIFTADEMEKDFHLTPAKVDPDKGVVGPAAGLPPSAQNGATNAPGGVPSK